MGLQEGIVYLIIIGSVAYTIYSILKMFTKKEETSTCGCSGCDVKDHLKELKNSKEILKKIS